MSAPQRRNLSTENSLCMRGRCSYCSLQGCKLTIKECMVHHSKTTNVSLCVKVPLLPLIFYTACCVQTQCSTRDHEPTCSPYLVRCPSYQPQSPSRIIHDLVHECTHLCHHILLRYPVHAIESYHMAKGQPMHLTLVGSTTLLRGTQWYSTRGHISLVFVIPSCMGHACHVAFICYKQVSS